MLIILSPAKGQNFESLGPGHNHTRPDLGSDSEELVALLRDYGPQGLSKLMGISDKLGTLNAERYAAYETPAHPQNAKAAALAFSGDVYRGLAASELSPDDLDFAQQHLRILSGLYGVLRPLDLIQAHRLEMGTKLPSPRGKNLYEFWGARITQKLQEALDAQGDEILVNLASNEYFKSVKKASLKAQIITPSFKDQKNGSYKMISFFAKFARGAMTRWIIQNRIRSVDQLRGFAEEGYVYNESLSGEETPVFTRG